MHAKEDGVSGSETVDPDEENLAKKSKMYRGR
jgi:hypothetical protein